MDEPVAHHPKITTTTTTTNTLHTSSTLRRTPFYRVFAVIYTIALASLFYHHSLNLFFIPHFLQILLLVADLILAFQWFATQLCFRYQPIRRKEYPENLTTLSEHDIPAVDIFICTADPYKEPPMGVVNTALSVMAYEYYYSQSGQKKLSVYVSDDGGSQLTLFAFIEAAKFAKHWLPFCREYGVEVRAPEVYFKTHYCGGTDSRSEAIQTMYERMKTRVERVVDKGRVGEEDFVHHLDDDTLNIRNAFSKWTNDFTRQDHPPVVQLLLDDKSVDTTGSPMPNLIYVTRGKTKTHPHHFKAGALNTLLRVSATMTNAPIILTLDCDFFSNNPHTLTRVLCYFLDSNIRPELGYVQFPQIFHGMNRNDIYACEHKRLFQINPLGFDGFRGPNYVGSNCFFQRRAFFGGPTSSSFIEPEIPELSPNHYTVISNPNLALAHCVAEADYESRSSSQWWWGSKIGFRYGSLVEDFYTGYRLQCEGWRSVFCNPDDRPAFMGDIPVTLVDLLGQCKRWSVGLLEALFCEYSMFTYGVKSMGLCMAMGYAHYSIWPLYTIPICIYALLPPLALLNGVSLLPEIFSGWGMLYVFLFVGAYGQDLLDFILAKGTFPRWWNCQRMWNISGLSCFLFGLMEYTLQHLGIPVQGFNITTKQIQEDGLSKRYKQGIYEFGVESPMFIPISIAAVINLVAGVAGVMWVCFAGSEFNNLGLEILLCTFAVLNSWPVYEAMVLRSDQGRMPSKITLLSVLLVLALCLMSVAAVVQFSPA